MISYHKQYSTLKPLLATVTLPDGVELEAEDIVGARIAIRRSWGPRGELISERALDAGDWSLTGSVLEVEAYLQEEEVLTAGLFEAEVTLTTAEGAEIVPTSERIQIRIDPAITAPELGYS
jgi:hypothetical protein